MREGECSGKKVARWRKREREDTRLVVGEKEGNDDNDVKSKCYCTGQKNILVNREKEKRERTEGTEYNEERVWSGTKMTPKSVALPTP